ncbi:MAG: anthranilate synthase component I family protein [Chitinophagaceae bacterium]|nr:MAG: anthranilate synthase component I family protein [Chitinophagaceae bacterium]
MNVITTIFRAGELAHPKQKVLNWLQRFSTFSFLDNHSYPSRPGSEEILAAGGARARFDLRIADPSAFQSLDTFINTHQGQWIFGHLGFACGSEPGSVKRNTDRGFGDCFFFVPDVLVRLDATELVITADDPQQVFKDIDACSGTIATSGHPPPNVLSRLSREEYLDTIDKLRQHILRGDCYEINFCQEFYAEDSVVDPLAMYHRLAALSPAPFAAFYRVDDQWLACSSPERYLRKQGSQVISQPIKGTLKRDPLAMQPDDEAQARVLYNSAKDRSENVMIVDLVRNDLSRFCIEGSVKVDELYGVYVFPQVYQMISTISGEVDPGIPLGRMLADSFPMGSMTGAPKRRVTELITEYEVSARGLYSGTVGYIRPDGDFDFNVVIRSILYDSTARYLSLPAGSGITFYSDPSLEWEECLIKAAAMRRALG